MNYNYIVILFIIKKQMVQPDKFGRTWKGRKIVWLKSVNCSREALYRWSTTIEDGKRKNKLVYDKKNGMCDEQGHDVRETRVELIPALEGKVEGTWERFPDTDDVPSFTKVFKRALFSENSDMNVEDTIIFDNKYSDDEIIIY